MARPALKEAPIDELVCRREARLRTSTFNEEAREVEVLWAAGADVIRYDWTEGGRYIERLSMEPKHIRLDRFRAGMSLMDSHEFYGMENRLGTVLPGSVRFAAGKAYATVKLSRNAKGEALLQDLKDGHGFPVSVSYKVHRSERTEATENSLPIVSATDWEPLELSAVPVPADPGAHSRSQETAPTTQTRKATKMPKANVAQVPELEDDFDHDAAGAVRAEERSRILELESIGRIGRADQRTVRKWIDQGLDVDQAREEVRDRYRRNQVRHSPPPMYGDDNVAQVRQQAINGIAALLGAPPKADEDDELVGRSAQDIVLAVLEAEGADTRGMRPSDIAKMALGQAPSYHSSRSGMHHTTDIPALFVEGTRRSLIEGFQSSTSPLIQFSVKKNAKDFRPSSFIRPGEAPQLEKVNEGGEITYGTLAVEKNGLKLETWARIFALTEQAFQNDDLGAFADLVKAFTDISVDKVDQLLFEVLSANNFGGQKMGDGVNFFHATHGNLGTAGAINEANVAAAELAMRTQKNVNGSAIAGTAPVALVVGPAQALAAKKFVAAITPATSGDANPYSGQLKAVIIDRYSGSGWWLFGSRPALVHGFLEGGPEGPEVATRDGWDRLAREFRAVMHFAAGPYDYRSAFFNLGA